METRLDTVITHVGPRRGRPRKFSAPARSVTLTLPDHVIAALKAVDRDLSRAVVRLTQPELQNRPRQAAELATFGRRAVIVVNPTKTLEERTGVMLVPLSDGRALISFDESMTVAQLELSIQDAIDDHKLSGEDAEIFAAVAEVLKSARRSGEVVLHQRSIILLESAKPVKRRPAVAARRRRRSA